MAAFTSYNFSFLGYFSRQMVSIQESKSKLLATAKMTTSLHFDNILSAYLINCTNDPKNPVYSFYPTNAGLSNISLLPLLKVYCDPESGYLTASLENFQYSDIQEVKVSAVITYVYGNYYLVPRKCEPRSIFPVIELAHSRLTWYHIGLVDQLALMNNDFTEAYKTTSIGSNDEKNDIVTPRSPLVMGNKNDNVPRSSPLVIYNPPMILDCCYSTYHNLASRLSDFKKPSRMFLLLNRRVRHTFEYPGKLNKDQEQYYKVRNIQMPVGSKWYSVSTIPGSHSEWDVDTFLVAECESLECLKLYIDLFIGTVSATELIDRLV
jgi:hypothetical protein